MPPPALHPYIGIPPQLCSPPFTSAEIQSSCPSLCLHALGVVREPWIGCACSLIHGLQHAHPAKQLVHLHRMRPLVSRAGVDCKSMQFHVSCLHAIFKHLLCAAALPCPATAHADDNTMHDCVALSSQYGHSIQHCCVLCMLCHSTWLCLFCCLTSIYCGQPGHIVLCFQLQSSGTASPPGPGHDLCQ